MRKMNCMKCGIRLKQKEYVVYNGLGKLCYNCFFKRKLSLIQHRTGSVGMPYDELEKTFHL